MTTTEVRIRAMIAEKLPLHWMDGEELLRLLDAERAISEGRLKELFRIGNELRTEWKRAENAEAAMKAGTRGRE